jgi:Protein of unknown function (DUF2865)
MIATEDGRELLRLPHSYRASRGIKHWHKRYRVVHRRCSKHLNWHAATLAGVLAAAMLAPGAAHAAGLFDFLFGNSDEPGPPQPPPQSYAEPPPALGPVAPAPLGAESVRGSGGSTGHVVAYCVRLCDGQHFPLEHMTNATPVETCRAMCPASKTKVFFGSEIGAAVAKDGARYTDLDTAYTYRKQLVANCTCNGKDAFGLAPFDLSSDPTLRPGDIVSTKDGALVAYAGRGANGKAFMPVDPSSVAGQLNSVTSRVASTKPSDKQNNKQAEEAPVEDDPGTITQTPAAPQVTR